MTGRRYRAWACPCCRRAWVRRKGEERPVVCRRCDERTVAARVWRPQRACRHDRDERQVRDFNERLGSKPRTRSGRVLVVSPEVRATWNEVRRARRSDAVIRRAQRWLDALLAESRDNYTLPDGSRSTDVVRWTKSMRLDHGKLEVSRHAGGSLSSPSVHRDDSMHASLYGEYRRAIFKGRYEVRLNVAQLRDPDDLRATIVHEALHVLDGEAQVNDRGHDHLWKLRLRRMLALFPPTAYGVRTSAEAIEGWTR